MDKIKGKKLLDSALMSLKDGRIFQARYLFELTLSTMTSVDKTVKGNGNGDTLIENKAQILMVEEAALRLDFLEARLSSLVLNTALLLITAIPMKRKRCLYEKFGMFFTSETREIVIEESTMYTTDHFKNLSNMLDALLLRCKNLTFIEVMSCERAKHKQRQYALFKNIQNQLAKKGIVFSWRFVPSFSQTSFILSNGYVLRAPHQGIHFVMNPKPELDGIPEQAFRRSKKAIISVFYIKKRMPNNQLARAKSFAECFNM